MSKSVPFGNHLSTKDEMLTMKVKGERNYKIILRLCNGFFKRFNKYQLVFPERLPTENGLIFIFNHKDYLDIPLVFSVLNTRPVHALVKIEVKKELVGKMLSLMGTVFVDRSCAKSRTTAKDKLKNIVQSGSNILIAPEGTRNKTDSLLLPFVGRSAVRIAQETNRPIIAFAISRSGVKGRQKLIRVCKPFFVGMGEDLDVANNRLYRHLYDALLENESELGNGI